MVGRSVVVLGVGAAFVVAGCNTAALSGGGALVATSQSAPVDSGWDPHSCRSLGYVVGRGGGAFGGDMIPNEKLIEYAMNDLRNKAAALGANFVQNDSPTLGVSGNTTETATTTATVSGTAFRCERQSNAPIASVTAPPVPTTPCVPGITQACVGPGGCKGGQACADDGSKFLPCDCGTASAAPPVPPLTSN